MSQRRHRVRESDRQQCAVGIGGGRDCLVENNVFVDNHPAIGIDARGLDKNPVWANNVKGLAKSLADMDHHNPPYSERYPELMGIDRWVAAGGFHQRATASCELSS
ncbi:MAG: hypothetical protein VX290_09280 [Candidatus Latescibacterota bacterium]|nr:hypothetical protein [Candidatus Latescibacterota bacterium]MEE3263017.1 hypothetical protein [Candidatus Latescibacterota bacterium]